MANTPMKTLTIGENTYEITDEQARTNISSLSKQKITNPTDAAVGQILSVKAVDENNTPTEWETIDIQNSSGTDGYSPTATVTETADGATITITDKNGTTTATIKDGTDGTNGKDGTSVTHSWNGTTLSVTSASGTSSANLKGETGKTAYQYAKDGGYTGTEAEFITRMSEDYALQSDLDSLSTELSNLPKKTITTSITDNDYMMAVKTDGNMYRLAVDTLKNHIINNENSCINVSAKLGYGTTSNPIDLSTLGITNFTTLYFSQGTYYVSPLSLSGVNNVTIFMPEAEIILTGEYFITGYTCPYFTIYGGKVNGNGKAEYFIQLNHSKNCTFNNVIFYNCGSVSFDDVAMLRIFGESTGFHVENCTFDTCMAGVVASDGYIHTYGILINRLTSTGYLYPESGIVRNCYFTNITSQSNGDAYGDGDGIFIQIHPYLNDEGVAVFPEAKIIIDRCIFKNCKKRGVKGKVRGLIIENCIFDGDFYFAAIDMQVGHTTVRNCTINNTSNYTQTMTSAIVASDGGFTIENCKISAPYVNADGSLGWHPAIRYNTRLANDAIPDTMNYDICRIHNCYFDNCSRPIYANDTNSGATAKYVLEGLEVTNCRFGFFTSKYPLEIADTIFTAINVFKFTDFLFDAGKAKSEVVTTLTDFKQPMYLNSVPVVYSFDLYSKYWRGLPMYASTRLTAYHINVIFEDYKDNMGGVYYKHYGKSNSTLIGTKNPSTVTTDGTAFQLLTGSQIGDVCIDKSNGNIYICTKAGEEYVDSTNTGSIGTWKQISFIS